MISLFVGNLPFNVKEADLQVLFEQYGQVYSVNLVQDADTGRPRGFAFVEMEDRAADRAIHHLNRMELGGNLLRVNRAQSARRQNKHPK